MNKYRSLYNTTLSLIINLLLVMGCFILCRVIFLIENLKAFSDLTAGRIWRMFEGGFLFDTSAILYTNLLYIFLMLIPLHYKENAVYQKIIKGIFVTTNLIVIIMNLMDTVYFQYTHRRTTASVFSEFKNEGNLGDIIGTELVNHWYLTLFAIAFGYALFKLYRKPKPVKVDRFPPARQHGPQTACRFIMAFICLLWRLECTCASAECAVDLPVWFVLLQSATPISM